MLGVLVGGLIVYGIVYWGGKKLVKRYGGYFGLQWEQIQWLKEKFKSGRIDEAALTAVRLVPFLPIGLVSLFCGFVRLSLWEFIWTTAVGTMIRILGLSLLGWYLGREYLKYATRFAYLENYIAFGLFVVVLAALIFIYVRRQNRL